MTALALALTLAGCRRHPGGECDFEVTLAEEISTVATVQWTTPRAEASWLEFGLDEDLGTSTQPTQAQTEHSAVLLGLRPERTYQVGAFSGDGQLLCTTEVTTGSLPNSLPAVEVSSESDLPFMVFEFLGGSFHTVILDGAGEIVWHYTEDRGHRVLRSRISRDRQWVMYGALASDDQPEAGQIVRVSLDGATMETVEAPSIGHDWVELPDGTMGFISVYPQEVEGTDGGTEVFWGDRILEVDWDGNLTEVWNAFDWFDPLEIQGDADLGTWTHANALDYDDDEDCYYLSLRNFGTILKIDRSTGEILWALSGVMSDFTFVDPSTAFEVEHQFDVLSDSIVVFDNGSPIGTPSKAIEFALDFEAITAEETWRYVSDPPVSDYALGDVDRLDNGDTLVTWTTAGHLQRVTPGGEVSWELTSELAYGIGYVQTVDDLYVGP